MKEYKVRIRQAAITYAHKCFMAKSVAEARELAEADTWDTNDGWESEDDETSIDCGIDSIDFTGICDGKDDKEEGDIDRAILDDCVCALGFGRPTEEGYGLAARLWSQGNDYATIVNTIVFRQLTEGS